MKEKFNIKNILNCEDVWSVIILGLISVLFINSYTESPKSLIEEIDKLIMPGKVFLVVVLLSFLVGLIRRFRYAWERLLVIKIDCMYAVLKGAVVSVFIIASGIIFGLTVIYSYHEGMKSEIVVFLFLGVIFYLFKGVYLYMVSLTASNGLKENKRGR